MTASLPDGYRRAHVRSARTITVNELTGAHFSEAIMRRYELVVKEQFEEKVALEGVVLEPETVRFTWTCEMTGDGTVAPGAGVIT